MAKQDKTIKKVTIYDIAKIVGTSPATVSRVLSNSNYPVNKETRKKILDVALKMNYSPNLIGRMLKKSGGRDIGVIIPTISNPFYPQLILGIETEAKKHGFNIILCNSFRDVSNEKKYIESMYQKQVKGILLSSIGEEHGFLKNFCENGVKIVGFDQNIDDFQCNKVGFDFTGGGMMAVDYLVNMGHEKIAFVSSPLTRKSRREIFMGYKLGLLKNGIKFSENYVYISELEKEVENGTYEFESGVGLAKKCLESANIPTAIFAVNDITAMGIMRGLISNGVDVPGDISIIGFDNIEFSAMVNPSLTTINQPSFETGKLACKILIENLLKDENNDENDDEISIMLEPSLIERKSVRNLKE
jgi:LacI family transcriptional regulator